MFGDLSYTNKDMQSIREEVMEYIRTHDPRWTDYNESSIQLQYVDIVTGVVDMMCYYLDNQALETYLSTARQEKNVKGILSTLNYEYERIGSAKGEVTISRIKHQTGISGSTELYLPGRIIIPKWTRVYNSNDKKGIEYLTLDDAVIPDDQVSTKVEVVQGIRKTLRIPVESLKYNYKVYILDIPQPLEYIEITTEGWEKVPDAFLEIKGGQKYSVHVDSKDKTYIMFTFDWKSYLPTEAGAYLEVSYIETMGAAGKIGSGYLSKLGPGAHRYMETEDISDSLGVTNEKSTYGAFDKPNINLQKANGRLWLQTYDRIITLQDLSVMLKKNPWVLDCYVCDWRTNPVLEHYPHIARGYIVTRDKRDLDETTAETVDAFTSLREELQGKTVLMTSIKLYPCVWHDEEWHITLKIEGNSNAVKERICSEVQQKLIARYTLDGLEANPEESRLKFNMEVRCSTLEAEIFNMSDSITKVTLPITEDYQLREEEFLNISSIVVDYEL